MISPVFCAGLRQLADEDKVEAIWREYRQGDLSGAFLVIAATDCEEVNAAVAAEAEGCAALTCVVDYPEKGNLLVPSVIRRGDLSVTVSTAGRCPALAKKLRTHIESSLIPEYARLLDLVACVRDDAKHKGVRIDAALWQDLLSSDIIDLVKRGMVSQAREQILAMVALKGKKPRREAAQTKGGL